MYLTGEARRQCIGYWRQECIHRGCVGLFIDTRATGNGGCRDSRAVAVIEAGV